MKKHYLLVAFLLVSFLNKAQGITLSQADFATGGDTVRTSNAVDNGFDYLSTGVDYIWDFSSLSATSQNLRNFSPINQAPFFVQFLFGAAAPENYQASYFVESTDLPVAQITSILPITIENIYQYSRSTVDSITNIGYSMKVTANGTTFDLPIKSDTIETHYRLPLSYGDTNRTRSYTRIDFNPFYNVIWIQYKKRQSIADGYGTLSTPFGTFSALRIKHEVEETDSIFTELPFIGATWIPLDLPLVREYEWWTNGEKMPLLKITTNEILGNETVTAIEYRDNYLGLDAGLKENEIEFSVFPVPAAEVIHVSSKVPFTGIQILDRAGRSILFNEYQKSSDVLLDIRDLAQGVYELRLFNEKSVASKKIIKE